MALFTHLLGSRLDFMVLGDLNARSRSFRDHRSNRKGLRLETFLMNNPVVPLDVPSPTHIGNGYSNPDQALVSAGLSACTDSLTVDDYITSDHLTITFTFTLTGPPSRYTYTRTNRKKADWKQFNDEVHESTAGITALKSTEDIDAALEKVGETFKDATAAIPTIAIDPNKPPPCLRTASRGSSPREWKTSGNGSVPGMLASKWSGTGQMPS
jgi:hypothetical protein